LGKTLGKNKKILKHFTSRLHDKIVEILEIKINHSTIDQSALARIDHSYTIRPSHHLSANHNTCFPEGGSGGGMGAAESKATLRQAAARLDLTGGLMEQLTAESVASVQVTLYILYTTEQQGPYF